MAGNNTRTLDENDDVPESTVRVRTTGLDGIKNGDSVWLSVTGHRKARVYLTVAAGDVGEKFAVVSPGIRERLKELAGETPTTVVLTKPTDRDRWKKRLTVKHAATILVFLAALFACTAALIPIFVQPSSGELTQTQERLNGTAVWHSGTVLTASDVENLGQARAAALKVKIGSDLPPWFKITSAIVVFAGAIATSVVAWKAAERGAG